jgi:hypothetical protein
MPKSKAERCLDHAHFLEHCYARASNETKLLLITDVLYSDGADRLTEKIKMLLARIGLAWHFVTISRDEERASELTPTLSNIPRISLTAVTRDRLPAAWCDYCDCHVSQCDPFTL